MKFQWIGQNGFIFYTKERTILVDPYLSNSCNKTRYTPIKKEIFDVTPDIIICTHDHLDHVDKESLIPFLEKDKNMELILPYNAYKNVLSWGYKDKHNHILFAQDTSWTSGDVVLTGTKAYHSDLEAMGVIIEAEGKKIYVTGDTLYNTSLAKTLPTDIHTMFVCTNGIGNNMNMTDAKRFAKDVSPKYVYPVHIGMFDQIDPHTFDLPNAKYATPYVITDI